MRDRATATLTRDHLDQTVPAEPVRTHVSSATLVPPVIASPVAPSTRTNAQTLARGSSEVAASASNAQPAWAAVPLRERLAVLARTRDLIALDSAPLTSSISPDLSRSAADTMAAEVLPLLAACRFLEHSAARILRPRSLGRLGRPFWLPGVSHRIHRVPLGRVLLIAPGNYPLFLPGVQALQALAAGNCVVWKPGRGGEAVALALAAILTKAGLPEGLLRVTGESPELVPAIITEGVDKIVLTGSAETGRRVLALAAATLTPVVAELSGCDSVIVLPGADLDRVVKALAFGMRLNGSATCMAPRRLLLVDSTADRRRELLAKLRTAFDQIAGVRLPQATRDDLHAHLEEARQSGATVHGELADPQQPLLLTDGKPSMRIAQADLFAPVLTLIDVRGDQGILAAESASPFALTCSIFGDPRRARALARQLNCGTVLLNDLIAPTADPRVPFGGRRASGFGVTRGAEGLLEMTAVQVVTSRRGGGTRHFEATNTAHESLFRAIARAGYAQSWKNRIAGARAALGAARGLGDRK